MYPRRQDARILCPSYTLRSPRECDGYSSDPGFRGPTDSPARISGSLRCRRKESSGGFRWFCMNVCMSLSCDNPTYVFTVFKKFDMFKWCYSFSLEFVYCN